MKNVLQEYGKTIIVIAGAITILLFLVMKGPGSFASMMVEPEATYNTASAEAIVDDIATRQKPTLEVTVKKLSRWTTYNMLDTSMFGIVAKNADGTTLPVTITAITCVDKNGERDLDPSVGSSLKPENKGYYYITYRTEETYRGAILGNEITKIFVVD